MTEVVEREKWGSTMDFILSCIGYSVGLGNVWRFPYLCGRSGGAAFLIPYLLMMGLAGLPTCYLELAIGQYSGLAPHLLYRRMTPVFAGIGYTMVIIALVTGVYYNMIIAWSLYYLGVSFTTQLPWETCNMDWGTDMCMDDRVNATCVTQGQMYFDRVCVNVSGNASGAAAIRSFWATAVANETVSNPAGEYLKIRVLGDSGSAWDLGAPRWELVIALAAAWLLVFACLSNGIKSSGKVVYFTATFPYVVLLILLIRGATLPGAYDGIAFYLFQPNWTKLAEAQVWGDAAQQMFFSLSLGGGGLTTLASYNTFGNNIVRDSWIIIAADTGTSIFAGFVIFSIIGFQAKNLDVPVAAVAKGGTTLAFAVYPDALTRLPGAPVWAILFFLMLITIGIDSQMVLVEVCITAVMDQWPSLRVGWKRRLVVASVCFVSFLCGLILTCPGGSHVLDMVDNYAGGWTLILACLFELVLVSYVYGIRRFLLDCRMMLGKSPNLFYRLLGYPASLYWSVHWVVVTPLVLTIIVLFTWISQEEPDEKWTGAMGWGISMICIAPIPIMAVWLAVYEVGLKKKPLHWLITPAKDWQPNDAAARLSLAGISEMKHEYKPAMIRANTSSPQKL